MKRSEHKLLSELTPPHILFKFCGGVSSHIYRKYKGLILDIKKCQVLSAHLCF